jgi:hypothetical protein
MKDTLVPTDFPACAGNVVFASRFNESKREPFLRFKHIVKHFAPHIHLVGSNGEALVNHSALPVLTIDYES